MSVHPVLAEILRQLLDEPALAFDRETRLDALPGWDSLLQVNTMFSVEEAFGVTFVGEEFARLETIGDVEDALARKGAT